MLKRGEAGIGSLILFIALILVAAVAAMVLLQTSSSLQSKALYTGNEAQKQVSTSVIILQAWGENASVSKTIDRIHFKVRLAAGSEPIQLSEAYVSLDTVSWRQTYRFNSTGSCVNVTDVNAAGVTFLIQALNGYNTPGVIQDGDVLDICVKAPSPIGQSADVGLGFVPKTGSRYAITTQTPSAMYETRVSLFPN